VSQKVADKVAEKGRAALHKEQRKTDILDAAKREFAMRGYHATNVADIAKALGIGHGTFYSYFESKLDVFGHVIDQVVLTLASAVVVEPPDAANSAEEYRHQVLRIGRHLHALFVADRDIARLLFVEGVGIDQAITDRLNGANQAIAAQTESYLQNGVRKGFLRADLDIEFTAKLMNAIVLEGARLQTMGAGVDEQVLERLLCAATDMLFQGIARSSAHVDKR